MQSKRKEELLEFCRQLGITMNNLDILNTALTHTSYAHEAKEQPRPEHNERIEFLGDSVLSIIVSTYMYKNFPKLNEGELTLFVKLHWHSMRIEFLSASTCASAKAKTFPADATGLLSWQMLLNLFWVHTISTRGLPPQKNFCWG